MPSLKANTKQSTTWRGIKAIWNKFTSNLQWVVGNGQSIRFWVDKWVDGCLALKDYVSGHLPTKWDSIKVSEMVDQEGT